MVSTKFRSPIFWPARRCAQCGDRDMLSWPPATTIVGIAERDVLRAERDRAQARSRRPG